MLCNVRCISTSTMHNHTYSLDQIYGQFSLRESGKRAMFARQPATSNARNPLCIYRRRLRHRHSARILKMLYEPVPTFNENVCAHITISQSTESDIIYIATPV